MIFLRRIILFISRKGTFCLRSLGCLGFLGLTLSHVVAGEISLQLNATVDLKPERLHIKVELTNLGNESAHELRPILRLPNKVVPMRFQTKLLPKSTMLRTYQLKAHPYQIKGSYYIPMHLFYRDAAGAKYVVPYLIEVVSHHKTTSEVDLGASDITLPDDQSVDVVVHNKGHEEKTIHLTAHTAMDIKLELPQTIKLAGNDARELSAQLKFPDLAPNHYTIFVLAEYVENNLHYSTFKEIQVKVIEEASHLAFLFNRTTMAVSAGVLALLALIQPLTQLIRRRL